MQIKSSFSSIISILSAFKMQDVFWGLFQSIGWYGTGVANWEDIRSVSPPQPISWGRTSRRIYWAGRATRVRMQIANISFPLRHSSLLCQFIWQIIQVGIWNIRTQNEKSTFLGHLRMWLPSLVGKWLEEARGEGDSTQFSLSLPAACYSATVSTALIDGKITNPRKTEILAKYNLLPNPISFDSHNLSSFVFLMTGVLLCSAVVDWNPRFTSGCLLHKLSWQVMMI